MKHLKLLGLLCVWLIGSGCVSMQEYEDIVMENGQLKRVMRNSNKTIQSMEKEKNRIALKNKMLAKQNQELKGVVINYKRSLIETKKNYDQVFKKKLQKIAKMDPVKQFGQDFQINPQTGGIILEGDVFFNPGSSTLKRMGKRILTKLTNKLQKPSYNNYSIEVAGHTDSDPVRRSKRKFKDNWWLSCARAHSVLQYVVAQGISPTRLHIAGYSFFKPRTLKKGRKMKKLNRRVELVLQQNTTRPRKL